MTITGLTGGHLNALRFHDGVRYSADISIGLDRVYIDGVVFSPEVLRFLADMVDRVGRHDMTDCHWIDCPEHKCEYTMAHTRNWCGRPTCREA